jgi:hypothetical protein
MLEDVETRILLFLIYHSNYSSKHSPFPKTWGVRGNRTEECFTPYRWVDASWV